MPGREELMREALRQAEKARGRTSPNPMVGSVITKRGRVIARGFHARAGQPHAEIVALEAAGKGARGADVYVTLEPCSHTGRTGPCADALIAAGVRRVFVAMRDPFPLVDGRGIRRLRGAGIEVEVGLCGDDAARLNEAFIHSVRHGRPFVVAKIAQSLDGRVATRAGESKWITGEAARQVGHALRGELDAILVGSGTVLADDPKLTCRVSGGRDPIRIVLDTQARTPARAAVVRAARSSAAPTWVVVGRREASLAHKRALEKAGAEVIEIRSRRGRIDLEALMAELHARQVRSLLVEGGPTVIGGFVDARLVDKVHVFVAPLLIGGTGALAAVGAEGAAKLADGLSLERVEVESLGRDLHVSGYVAS